MGRDLAFRGFDTLVDNLVSNWVDGFNQMNKFAHLPYNIIKEEDGSISVEVAMAGYLPEDVDLTLTDGVLRISANKNDTEVKYVHKGISAKNFNAVLAVPTMYELGDVSLDNGILRIQFLKNQKTEKKIPIKTTTSPQVTKPQVA